jgi:glycosyltransferase involved in cell wall biosynthesis
MIKPNTLYLSYTGLLEPLGKSQVLAYLTRLSQHYEITLITFEKQTDLADHNRVKEYDELCSASNIKWLPKKYHNTPRLLAKIWDAFSLMYSIYVITKRNDIKLIHCRSYIPSIAAWLVGKFTKVPFIFDMRALLIEELIDANRLLRGSYLNKLLAYFESKIIYSSSAVVSLTNAAIPYLLSQYPELTADKFTVIPTCVDLTNFHDKSRSNNKKMIIGTMGSVVSGWYHIDWLMKTLKLSKNVFQTPAFKIISRDDKLLIEKVAESEGLDKKELLIEAATSENIQEKIEDLNFAILYFTSGLSKLGSAPTRMAELLSLGIPILGNSGVGDMAEIINKYRVGIVVDGNSDDQLLSGLKKMKDLLGEDDYGLRCKEVAFNLFSADQGADNYKIIYEEIISNQIQYLN